MAKRKRTARVGPEAARSKPAKEPKLTRAAFQVSLCFIVLGLLAQLVMAVVVYPALPEHIPAGWIGSSVPQNIVPSWLVFIVFPGAQVVMLVLVMFSPRDPKGKRVMDTGNAVMLALLTLLFTALQSSAFHMPHR